MKDPELAARFERAGEAWEVALQLAALRERAGISQKELARRLKSSQQHISRLESPSYEGHSLPNLRRVARALNARVRVVFEPSETTPAKKPDKRVPSAQRKRRPLQPRIILEAIPEHKLDFNGMITN